MMEPRISSSNIVLFPCPGETADSWNYAAQAGGKNTANKGMDLAL
jgi:hypothetical protein